jgi:hypothetical protein
MALVAGMLGASACDRGQSSGAAFAQRDSVGVTIAENVVPDRSVLATWSVRSEPDIDVGQLEGDEVYQLFRVSAAARLSDGRIVVGNGGSQELRFFDATGIFLTAVGREGKGPGEFTGLGMFGMARDSLHVFDWSLYRVSVFDQDGRFGRSYLIQVPGIAFPQAAGMLADGSWVIMSGFAFSPQKISAVVRDTSLFVRVSPEGAVVDSLGRFPTVEFFMWGDGRSTTAAARAFGKSVTTGVGASRIYVGLTEEYEILCFAPTGELTSIIRKTHSPRPVTAADIAAYKEEDLGRLVRPSFRPQMERLLADMPYPETMPAFGDLKVDAGGYLWVQEFDPPGTPVARWTVFDLQGRAVAAVETPRGLTIRQIGTDFVLGTWRDDLGVEHVRLHTLVKPSPRR